MKSAAHKLITWILPKGLAPSVLESVKDRFELTAANINSARGIGKITPLKYRGLGDQAEMEILTVLVDAGRAEEVFGFICFDADINRPHGGLMTMQALLGASELVFPDLPAEH
ncbi:MAG: hypothetical protein ACU85U_20225 [Gammaproteobacteria bacterium]|jgi:hypothetical protein